MRSTKFLVLILLFATLGAQPGHCDIGVSVAPGTNSQMETEGERVAEQNVIRDRVAYQRQLNDLITLFPEYLPRTSAFYQAGISNYVEDQWNRFLKEEGCTSTANPCSIFAVAGAYSKYTMPVTMYLAVDHAINRPFAEQQALPAESSAEHLDRVAREAHVTSQELLSRLEELNKYLSSGDRLKPVAWSIVGTGLTPPPDITITAQKLGAYHLLTERIFAYQLPADKQGYVGCIAVLLPDKLGSKNDPCHGNRECIETIQPDTKEFLLAKLTELKSHNCTATYAAEMDQK